MSDEGEKASSTMPPLQLLTFTLDEETFGADIGRVQEVLEYTSVTRVPRTPDYMLGVINLRGKVLPVVDLRKQFDMPQKDVSVDTCIVIVEVDISGEATSLGLLADSVKEVIALEGSQISDPPRIGTQIDTRYILGMGKYCEEFVIILDLQKVFSKSELTELADQAVTDSAPDFQADTTHTGQ